MKKTTESIPPRPIDVNSWYYHEAGRLHFVIYHDETRPRPFQFCVPLRAIVNRENRRRGKTNPR